MGRVHLNSARETPLVLTRPPVDLTNVHIPQYQQSECLRYHLEAASRPNPLHQLSLADLPPIRRAEASVSDVSSLPGVEDCVDQSVGCFVTKTIKYTHQLSHWVNATRDEDAELVVRFKLIEGS